MPESPTARRGSFGDGSMSSSRSSIRRRMKVSFASTQDDLIIDEIVRVQSLQLHEDMVGNLASEFGLDWSLTRIKKRIIDASRLIQRIFWAFENVEDQEFNDTARNSTKPSSGPRHRVGVVVQREAFVIFFSILTIYALVGPDVAMAFGHTAGNPRDSTLATINTMVLGLFILEEMLLAVGIPGYICSARCLVDTIAALSMIGDTRLGSNIFQSDAVAAGKGSRLFRLLRIGRSGRYLRVLRMVRLAHVARVVPRILWWWENNIQELAIVLLHNRVRRIFHYLDVAGQGVLNSEGMNLFNMVMTLEFCNDKKPTQGVITRIKALGNITSMPDRVKLDLGDLENEADRTFPAIMRRLLPTPLGHRLLRRCVEDIQCLRASCAVVDRALTRISLKVCLLVLGMLITLQLLEPQIIDISVAQGLKQLDLLAQELESSSPAILCPLLSDYQVVAETTHLELLILQRRMYWDPYVGSCDAAASEGPLITNSEQFVYDFVSNSAREAHEFFTQSIHNDTDAIISIAVFDTHKEMRGQARDRIKYTVAIVILLLGLVTFFGWDIQKMSSSQVLHPLWDMMDDMCALKSIEVLGQNAHSEDINIAAILAQQRKRSWSLKRLIPARCITKVPIADELLALRKAFARLQTAMYSWAKYVPVVLLQQLFEAGVEAKIGCAHSEVSIFFCDIDCFQEKCVNLTPQGVLELLEVVHTAIHSSIEDNGGTLLEFIGDEILAVFNAPTKIDFHNQCAIMAAVEAQEQVAALPNGGIRLRCGVHKAKVLCGNIGSPSRMKYGVLGDGVNLAARVKSLNSRFGTQFLMSSEIAFEDMDDDLLTRPIGNLVLKGRTTPTTTLEVLGKLGSLSELAIEGAKQYTEGYELYRRRAFVEAKQQFAHAALLLQKGLGCSEDKPSVHYIHLCEKYIAAPPPASWDGSEHLTKKSW
mmetsp:Transcript_38106/g.104913  ORF Transcript_38106/g.104913 Transcript_38106/m.104913 type:complete len:932 (-) Transcript_38106:198-2993(-)